MRLGARPESLLERVGLLSGLPPPGIFESWFGIMLARAVMAGTKLEVFETLSAGPLRAGEVAARCGTDPPATEKLLNALVGVGCLSSRGGRYGLKRVMRAWILRDGKYSFRDQILLHYLEWGWWSHCEDYLRTGKPLRIHQTMTPEEWGVYQRGMRSGIELPARWIARRLRLPSSASSMLEIGGSHGYFSVAICRAHRGLRSTVLDLPEAIRHAAPLLLREGMGDRVAHRAGDLLTEELGAGSYDLVFMASVAHHFDAAANRALVGRIARSLRPGGLAAIWEPLRVDGSGKVRQIGALLDLFFGLFSRAGTWSAAEIAGWFREAGLEAQKPLQHRLMPDLALHLGRKPR
jgi:SAM-dependent methyltransferase